MLKTIVDVLKVPESSVVGHMNWSTFTLRDLVTKNGGVSPFSNDGVRYQGSADDAALNAAVPRFKADAAAVARFAAVSAPHGARLEPRRVSRLNRSRRAESAPTATSIAPLI